MTSIQGFINNNRNKQIVVVQGLGFVGSVMSLVCANSLTSDYAVIGVDLDHKQTRNKIEDFNNGIFPLTADDLRF